MVTAAAPLAAGGAAMTAVNARDITATVRAERLRLGIVLAVVSLVSVLLSLFLARTIVRPLRRLARAAVRVRLGRAREVVVPRLPSRRDELGSLARALSDMSLALRARIDATEAFAADVTHELKNPLASLRSAVEGLATVHDPALQERLLGIVREDVHRLDRLITDISEASRLDAQLSRAKFEPVDIAGAGRRAGRAAGGARRRAWRARGVRPAGADRADDAWRRRSARAGVREPDRQCDLVFAGRRRHRHRRGGGRRGDRGCGSTTRVRACPEEEREAVFRRFQSIRPSREAFGQHSGLGLAIARTIVEGHGGGITVEQRTDRVTGARFVVRLPLADGG